MFDSNSSNILNNDLLLLSYNEQQQHIDPSLPFFHFPSSYNQFESDPENLRSYIQPNPDQDEDFLDYHHQQQTLPALNVVESCSIMEEPREISGSELVPKKRSSKKDRHSKINTARGPRDRRMRLSLDVARDFFGLQDMLGFDKASKTVEWLLTQAKSEIKKIARSLPQANNNHSFCRVGSKTASSLNNNKTDQCEGSFNDKLSNSEKSKGKTGKEKKIRQSRKSSFRTLPKDLRTKARERAKERTNEKNRRREFAKWKLCDYEELVINNNHVNYLYGSSNWSCFETSEESGTQSNNLAVNQQEDAAEESLEIINKWSMSSILDYHQSTLTTSIEHQHADVLSFLGKP